MITEIYTWNGKDLPVWPCNHWRELEHLIDTLCPEAYVLTINRELQPEITGLVFSQDPLTPANAVAAYLITEPEEQD